MVMLGKSDTMSGSVTTAIISRLVPSAMVNGPSPPYGKDNEGADRLLEDAKFLQEAGCFSMVLEGIPWELAETITRAVSIPTIGIGAGPHCDGQVLVVNDMLGMTDESSPKFVKRFAEAGKLITDALTTYIQEVKEGRFPDLEHSYTRDKR